MSVDQLLADLDTQVTNATTVMNGATALINGIAARIQTAVAAALASGATEDQLKPVQREADALKASAADLSAAITENVDKSPTTGAGSGSQAGTIPTGTARR